MRPVMFIIFSNQVYRTYTKLTRGQLMENMYYK